MVLHCGEAIIDLIPNADGALVPVPGGSQLNTAIALKRLGSKAGFVGSISQDAFGVSYAAFAEQEGIILDYTQRVSQPSALAVVQVDDVGQVDYSFYFEGTSLYAFLAEKTPAPDDTTWCIQYGSLAYYVEPLASEMQKYVGTCTSPKILKAFDINVRSALVSDPTVVQKSLIAGVHECDILKCTEEELDFLFPNRSESEIIRYCLDCDTSLICLTRGPEGASLITPSLRTDCPGRSVEVADTVGAGDSFHAAVLHYLDVHNCKTKDAIQAMQREQVAEMAAFGVAASAITCSRKGANAPYAYEVIM